MSGGDVITGPPDFVGVGTQRSGTTWWQRLLKRHPAIKTPQNRKKEQHFFDQFGRRPMQQADIKRYHELFPRGPGELSGEWTPRYMRDIWGPRVVAQAAPDAKLLIMFRDPVERYRSGVLHQAARSPDRSASWLSTDAIERGRYALQLRRVYDYFDEEQVLVLQYEQCIADPLEQYRRTLEFIGAPEHRPKDPKRTRGTATKSRREPIWDDLRNAIVRELEEEVAALDELVPGLDLSLWRNFEHLANASERVAPAPRPRISVRAGRGGPPDFVGVGTADAGCEWWHTLLLEHDSIDAPSTPSLDFFATFCTRAMTDEDVGAYHAHFSQREDAVVGEWTPGYMYEPWTPMLLHRAAPDAKLLVMLMNPVDRYAANLAQTRRKRRKETDSLSNTVSLGRYTSQLRGLLEFYDRDRILVLQLERCLEDPLGQYARTLEFFGVDDEFQPASLGGGAIRRARRILGRPAGGLPGAPEPVDVDLWPDLEVPMLKELAADVLELSALVPDLDLSLWPQFAHLATGRRAPSASGLDSRAYA
jgi:hypothetical protein